jgi:asparagine synthase (glutamine-hydrolysing)
VCGIIGILSSLASRVTLSREAFARARDLLTHRGPDASGLWDAGHILLGHRRLAVIDPTPSGAQPMHVVDALGRTAGVLVYNGELYNDADVRTHLHARGVRVHSPSDTATLAHALAEFGAGAPRLLRGMYALAYADLTRAQALLMRDPLGVKPLYYARLAQPSGHPCIAFASELVALAELAREITGVGPAPDWVVASAYLTTIRTTLGERTLFDGLRTLLPGETLSVDLRDPDLPIERRSWWDMPRRHIRGATLEHSAALLAASLRESVRLHVRSDVPVCVLLSGGLDSSVVGALAAPLLDAPRSFCAGARDDDHATPADDFAFAREASAFLTTRHREAPLAREDFASLWPDMVNRLGLPLSTPNETAIYHVARTLRSDACVVTLSGEGADELLAGYDRALDAATAFVRAHETGEAQGLTPGEFELVQASWVSLADKPAILRPDALAHSEHDEPLLAWYRDAFERVRTEVDDDDPLQAHLRWQRRVNLLGLLQRLDTATMLAGVEGRTPFADAEVALLCESLPLRAKFGVRHSDSHPAAHPASRVEQPRTKLALRRAFADHLPPAILSRPKASFPLPFERWMGSVPGALSALDSAFAREAFTPEAIAAIRQDPQRLWTIAWPMLNLAMWGRRWWG